MKNLKLKSAPFVYFSLLITPVRTALMLRFFQNIIWVSIYTAIIIFSIGPGGHYSFSQAPAIEWQNTIGGSGTDLMRSIQQTADGGYILGGYSDSGISGDKTEASQGSLDYWVVKLDSSGIIGWQNVIGGSSTEYLNCIKQTSDGGYILGGYSSSGISGDKTEANMGIYEDYWVVKLNSSGIIEWQNTIGGSSGDYLLSIQQTFDGGYILGGYSNSGISGDKAESLYGIYDYWIVKLNSSGNIQWQNTIGGSEFDYLYSIQQTADGGYILGGYSDSGISGDKTEASHGGFDCWVVKLNSNGKIKWQNTIGGNDEDGMFSIQQTTDGGYVLGGYSYSGISGDKTEASLGYADYWVVKLNNMGTIEWQNSIGGNNFDFLRSIKQTTDGGYILGGSSYSGISGDKTEASIGDFDYWVVKLGSSGIVEWENTIGGNNIAGGFGDDELYAIEETTDGGYIIGGYSDSGISGDKTESSLGGNDFWVVKLEGPCHTEICNGIDDNCNGLIDDGITVTISISAGGATTFCQGSSVILSAIHTGTSLQWKKNGVDIVGATSATYTATKTGDYTCVSTSLCGSATSMSIPVVMNKKPNASITADGPTDFCFGDNVTLIETPVAGCSYQWYVEGDALAGETSTTYVATYFGNYNCRVTKIATGCFKKSNIIYVGIICKEENNTVENTFSIFPNPSSDFITIETDFSTEKTIYLTNAIGQIVQTIITSENTITINLNTISSGIYFIKMEDGINSVTQKFIKQ